MENKDNDKTVTPGDVLAVIEEYLTGPGTYVEDETGFIRAAILGIKYKDYQLRQVKVNGPQPKYAVPQPGMIVIGFIHSLRTDIGVVTLIGVSNKKTKPLSSPLTGILHVSQVSEEYIKTMYDAFANGDLIKAKVLSDRNPYQLSTKEQGLGVILTTCSNCGTVVRMEEGVLKCPKCGNIEKRRVSKDYINLNHIEI